MSAVATSFDLSLPACDFTPPPYSGPSREQVLRDRQTYLSPGLVTYYKTPVMITDGHMQYLFDETGRRYLDLFAGIVSCSCGHCHPHIAKKVQEQVGRLQHTTTIYLNPNIAELGKMLAAKLPGDLDVAYFTNSGSEANDLAILMARLYTGNSDVVALRNCYHGASGVTFGLTSHSTWKFDPTPRDNIFHAACPDPYRSLFEGTPEEIARKSVDDLRDTIRYSTSAKLAAFIAEPIQGVGGTTHGHKSYLGAAYKVVREHGGLCISDEVQTGFGRTGHHYWGFQNYDVMPDMVVMAKSLGNGAPIGAVVTRREIAEVMKQKLHLNTFGGNPVSTAAAIGVLEVIDQDNLQANALEQGTYFIAELKRLQAKHALIGDVRGMGLMLGVEFVRDRKTKEPANTETAAIHEALKDCGVLIGKGGIFGNVLRIKPPMCITRADVDYAIAALDHCLTQL